ncbi:RidA family protein [Sphingomonas histidinilytica]|uniref:RidA family protein n=1 Tax=Rhizorhabdus histidinilytica TaxID=439228 RepID=UPI001ADA850D|nr:RidA family protein [Rhizorhabdus histidinilytica]MBO9379643.1 RidA family protein [Rhizorhabdus histidinilytica]
MTIQRFERLGDRLSHALVHDGIVYLTGQVADDVSQDTAGQTRQVLERIDMLLAKAGSDKSKILFAQIFLKDLNEFGQMNGVWEEWIPQDALPARATFGGILGDQVRIEIIVQAAVA